LPFNRGLWPDRYIQSVQSLALQSDASFGEKPEQLRHLALITFKGLIDILPDGRLANLRACEGQLSDGQSLTSLELSLQHQRQCFLIERRGDTGLTSV
jgi:hypothetical protein